MQYQAATRVIFGSEVGGYHADVLDKVRKEALVTYRLIRRDLSASLIPGILMSLAALQTASDWTAAELVGTLVRSTAYFFLYIYTFCLSNQIVGYREDCLNKPDRVIPSGMLSMRGALIRWGLGSLAFPVAAYALGGISLAGWAVAWLFICLCYNQFGLHKHWFSKNVVFITLGTIVLFAPAWEIAAPFTANAWRWILIIALSFGVTLHVQDLRDVEGDRAVGRRTLPMALGEVPTRWVMALGIVLLPLVTHFGLVAPTAPHPAALPIELGLAALNLLVGHRLVFVRSAKADHETYMFHTYWFCAVCAAGIILL